MKVVAHEDDECNNKRHAAEWRRIWRNEPKFENRRTEWVYDKYRKREKGQVSKSMESQPIIGLGKSDTRDALATCWEVETHSWLQSDERHRLIEISC
jgi:hypothetical protein